MPESQHDTAELNICVSLWKNTFCTVPFGKEKGQDIPENHNKQHFWRKALPDLSFQINPKLKTSINRRNRKRNQVRYQMSLV